MDFSKHEFRCSALGKIVSKSGKLTDTNKTYLLDLFIGHINGIQKDITSKYFEKGIYQEEDGITLLQKTLHQGKLVLKNKERKRNGWIHGEKDTAVDGIVYDIKNAWDRFTFGKADLTWDYEWQGRGYMWLDGAEQFRLFYCLNNTPEHMLIDEERKLWYKHHFVSMEDPDYLDLCNELRKAHNYDNMPLEERFKVWDVEHSDEKIETLKACITAARAYLGELWGDHQSMIIRNRRLMGLPSPSILLAEHDPSINATIISKG